MSSKTTEPSSTRIKKALAARNMTQTELCARTKISKSSLSEYLSGKHEPGQDKVFILAEALGVDPVWLWGYDVPMEKKEDQPDQKKSSPSDLQLTEGDRELFEVLKLIPADHRRVILDMIRSYANNLNKG